MEDLDQFTHTYRRGKKRCECLSCVVFFFVQVLVLEFTLLISGGSFSAVSCIGSCLGLVIDGAVCFGFVGMQSVCVAFLTGCLRMCGQKLDEYPNGPSVSTSTAGGTLEGHSFKGQKIFLACCSPDAVLSTYEEDYRESSVSDDSTSSYGSSAQSYA